MKILFVASEAAPFVRTGGLGDVAGALPKAFNKLGHDARVIIPYYKEEIKDSFKSGMRFVGSTFVDLSWRRQYAGVYEAVYDGVTYYFVDNEFYFKRRGLYGHFDDGERFAFFSKAVPEVLPLIGFFPDVLHCNDWHTALTPVYLDVYYRFSEEYRNIKTVFTIHNIEFQGKYGTELLADVMGLPEWAHSLVMYGGCVNYMKGGIESSAAVTTVSETYATEILDPYYSYGLESILSERRYKLHGVVNGIDTDVFDPSTDPLIPVNYTCDQLDKKAENKRALQEKLGLECRDDVPMVIMITRLVSHKGLDLVQAVMDDLMQEDIQLVIIGTGEQNYEDMFRSYADQYPEKMSANIVFDNKLAHETYAGGDLVLMPSKMEPCGLTQLIAMRYGTVPIIRETGGLYDTVPALNPETMEGRGFTFKSYNAHDMLDAVRRAAAFYQDSKHWKLLQKNDMKFDSSWNQSVQEYWQIYRSML